MQNNQKQLTSSQKLVKKAEATVHPGLACFFGLVTAAMSGLIALHYSNPDQGRVVTLAQSRVMKQQKIDRIKNDTHMPPRAKEIALRYLGGGNPYGSNYKSQ